MQSVSRIPVQGTPRCALWLRRWRAQRGSLRGCELSKDWVAVLLLDASVSYEVPACTTAGRRTAAAASCDILTGTSSCKPCAMAAQLVPAASTTSLQCRCLPSASSTCQRAGWRRGRESYFPAIDKPAISTDRGRQAQGGVLYAPASPLPPCQPRCPPSLMPLAARMGASPAASPSHLKATTLQSRHTQGL